MTTPQALLDFYLLAEKLKIVTRHSWLSDVHRQESVAEHTWMMALLAMVVMPELEFKLDQTKVLRMILIHDLAEALTKDMPVWEGQENKAAKMQAEQLAIHKLLSPLSRQTRNELLNIWEEYETRDTPEAKFVKVIDTLDVVTQHNATDISTWDDNDYLWQLSSVQDDFFNLDPYLRKVKDALDKLSIEKVSQANTLDKLDQTELNKRLGNL